MPPKRKAPPLPSCTAPPVKASRTRLYDIRSTNLDGDALDLTNREGIQFSEKKEDLVLVGAVDKTVMVTPMEMTDALDALGGFFFIRFFKNDGTERAMYAHVVERPKGGLMRLRDLEQPMATLRSCKMNRVYSLITGGKHYTLKTAALKKLQKSVAV